LTRKAADAGNAWAKKVLPQVEQQTIDRKKPADAAEKFAMVRSAAESGDLDAQRKLANYFIEGFGVAQDINAAIEWYKKAADAGDAIAMTQLGVLYDKGRGVPVDYTEAIRWYKPAAEKEEAQAQYNYGVLMYHGIGVERDLEQGREWIRRAANNGSQTAIRALQTLK
jgi:TPR repeat protein